MVGYTCIGYGAKKYIILMIWKHATPCREFKLFTMNEKQDNKLSGIFIKNNLS